MTDQTTTALAINDPEFEAKLRAMSGQYVGGSENFIPKLKVNSRAEDPKTKQDLEVGAFVVRTRDGDVYAKRKETVQFRLYAKRYGYTKFDPAAPNPNGPKPGAITARSVQLADFKRGSEYISSDGSLKCGKGTLPEGSKIQIKTKIYFYGTVTFKGRTAEGKEVDVVDMPVTFTASGKDFLVIDNIFKDFSKDGRRYFDYNLTLKPVYVAVGDGGLYKIDVEFTDLTNKLEFNDKVYGTLKKFFEYIEANNKDVEVKFNQARASKDVGIPQAEADVVTAGDLADDLIDEDENEEEF